MIKRCIFILWMMCGALSSFSQSTRFRIGMIDLPENFQDRNISLVETDQAGLLWFVTNGGLYRYDGSQVIRLDLHSKPSILHASITALLSDRRDHLWIGSKNGLTRLDLSTWTTRDIPVKGSAHPSTQDLYIRTIGEGRDGSIYASTENGRLYVVKNDSLRLILDVRQDFPNSYQVLSITSIQEPYPGQLWLTTVFGKLIRIRVHKGHYGPPGYFGLKEFQRKAIYNACFDSSGKCLILVENHGLYLLNTRTGAIKRPHQQFRNSLGKIKRIFMPTPGDHKAFLLTDQAPVGKNKLFVYDFENDSISEYTTRFPENLKDNRIDRLWTTSDHSVFISLNHHILELEPVQSFFKTFLAEADAISSIRCIYKQPGGKLYIGSYKEKFISLNENTGEKQQIAPYFVYKILRWNTDTLLLGTEGNGLFWFEPKKNKLTPIAVLPRSGHDPPMNLFITTLTREDGSRVWAGTYHGLFLVDLYAKRCRIAADSRLRQVKIFGVMRSGKHRLIATQSGILEIDPQTRKVNEFLKAGTPVNDHYTIYCLARVNKQIWMGTGGHGILIAGEDGHIADTINHSRGLADDIVYSLVSAGNWIIAGTRNGLSIINRQDHQIKNYSTLNYLPSNEFNHSAVCIQGKNIYMGSLNGLICFDTSDIPHGVKRYPQIPLHITSLTTEYKKKGLRHNYSIPYLKKDPLVVNSGIKYFAIHLGGAYEFADQLQYYYRLGDDAAWHVIGGGHDITFAGMHPGNYQLQVGAGLPDGHRIKNFLRMPLFVEPAFYQTIGFKILIALVLAGVVWLIIKYREKQLQREKQLRIKIAGDLHDEVGASLTRIYFQADTLSNKKLNLSHDDKTHLQHIASTSKEALGSMSDMVWSIDSRFDTAGDLLARMKDYLFELKNELDVLYHFSIQGEYEKLSLSQIVRQNLFLIFKEALNNAVKYGDGSEISILLHFGSFVRLELKNHYLPGNRHSGINRGGRGLQSMQQRAAAMKGTLHIQDQDGLYSVRLEIFQGDNSRRQ